jgi:hypothetical protein
MAFTKTRGLIQFLNKKLQEKCNKELTMELGFFSDMIARENVSFYEKNTDLPTFLLCLNIKKGGKKHCISSISCKLSGDEMEISSKTHKDYEGNKYNLLLRSASVLLAEHMKNEDGTPITKIVSRALNPISAFSMIKYFNASNDELDEYMDDNEIEPSEITLDDVQTFFDEKNDLGIDEDLNDEEIEALMMENPDFGYIAILEINLDKETIEKTLETYMSTLERIRCPPERTAEGTKKKRKGKRKIRTIKKSTFKKSGAKKRRGIKRRTIKKRTGIKRRTIRKE